MTDSNSQPTETAALFDDWATTGRAEGMERGHSPRAVQALEDMGIRPGDKLLDLGCGNGWASRWMRKKTGRFGFVAGVDFSAEMVKRAEETSGGMYGLQFRQAAFESLPWKDEHFDHAFSMEALYYASEIAPALASAARVLKSGGALTFCTDFYLENPHCHGWPEKMGVTMHLLGEDQWVDALASVGLDLVRKWRCLDPRPVSPDRESREEEEHFRKEVGSLAIRARKA